MQVVTPMAKHERVRNYKCTTNVRHCAHEVSDRNLASLTVFSFFNLLYLRLEPEGDTGNRSSDRWTEKLQELEIAVSESLLDSSCCALTRPWCWFKRSSSDSGT